jgi:hypothetical protein
MSSPAKLTIEFPSQEALEAFANWMTEEGEQKYWNHMEIMDEKKTHTVQFEYHWPLNTAPKQNKYKDAKWLGGDNTIRTTLDTNTEAQS